jgi:MoaA/NifB/PqqE/SkfB family radical SAM enzyme
MFSSGLNKGLRALPFIKARLTKTPAPLNVALHVTYRCNASCTYCDRHVEAAGRDRLEEVRKKELSCEELRRVARELVEMGARGFLLDGGEPLIRPELVVLLEELSGWGVETRMNTNGFLLPERSGWLAHLDKVKVSIDGPKEVHDRFRGRGAFEKAMRGVETARDEGVCVELTCVISSANVDRLADVLDIGDRYGARVFFQPARGSLFVGKKKGEEEYFAEKDRLRRSLEWLLSEVGNPALGNTKASVRHFFAFPGPAPMPCSAGWVSCAIDPYGRMTACPMLPARRDDPNVFECTVREGFERLRRVSCKQCWCARQVEMNLAWAGKVRQFL